MEEIIEAAKNANIHNFIENLPDVGHKARAFFTRRENLFFRDMKQIAVPKELNYLVERNRELVKFGFK